MLPLVELPEIVRHYAPWFESVFSPEALLQFGALPQNLYQ